MAGSAVYKAISLLPDNEQEYYLVQWYENCSGSGKKDVHDFSSITNELVININPNPTTNFCTLSLNNDILKDTKELRLEIININGKIQEAMPIKTRSSQIKINTTALPEGIYILNLINNDRLLIASEKMIKVK